MKIFRFILCLLAIFALLPVGSAMAGVDSYHDSGTFPIDETVWNDCTGEEVHLTGRAMWSSHEVVTKAGTIQWGFQTRFQGVTGVGLTTGIKYLANSGEHGYGTTIEDPDHPYHYAAGWTNTIRLISQGNAADLLIRHKVRVTVTPDYNYHVEIYDVEAICK